MSVAASQPQEFLCLVTWLQTFPVFTLKIIDGKDGEIAFDTVVDALSSLPASRCVLKNPTNKQTSDRSTVSSPRAQTSYNALFIENISD